MQTAHPVCFDENGAPISGLFDDPFFSRKDGAAETRLIFLQRNGLPDRWTGGADFTIAELGFGTGLNLIETWALWRQTTPQTRLRFVTFEAYPLPRETITDALAAWPERLALAGGLVDSLPTEWPDHGTVLCTLEPGMTLEIVIGNAEVTVPSHDIVADCWFLDGFAPSKNPAMWSAPLMQAVFDRTVPGGSFATYTAAGWVRRNLQAAGFSVTKQSGFGTKREMMTGVRPPA